MYPSESTIKDRKNKLFEDLHEEPAKKMLRPPLIYIEEVKEFLLLCRELEKRIGKNFSFKVLRNHVTASKTCCPDDCRAVVK